MAWSFWIVGAHALVMSQTVILSAWSDAKAGTIVNVVLLLALAQAWFSQGPQSSPAQFERDERREIFRKDRRDLAENRVGGARQRGIVELTHDPRAEHERLDLIAIEHERRQLVAGTDAVADTLVASPAEELRALQPIVNLPTDDRNVVAPLVALHRVRASAVHLPLVQALQAGIEQRSADVMVDHRPI